FSAPAAELENGAPPRPNTLTVDVCLTGVIFTAYLSLHYFRKAPSNHGKLILQASIHGLWETPRLILYSAAKFGVCILAFLVFCAFFVFCFFFFLFLGYSSTLLLFLFL